MKQASSHSMLFQVVFAVLAGVLLPPQCSAEFTPLSFLRVVDVTAGANVNSNAPPDEQELFSSSASGLFDETRQVQVVASGMGDTAEGTSTAFQQSLLQYSMVEAQAETLVSLNVNTSSGGGAFGDAVAELAFEFVLDAITDYQIIANIDHFGPVSDASVQLLQDDSISIFAVGEPTGYTVVSIMQSGTLSPGNYRLIGSADTILSYLGPTFPTTSGAEFSILFLLEVIPGDFDPDGDVDGRDCLVWQRGGSPSPLSSTDLAAWQANYGFPPLTATSVAVPEPGTWGILVAAVVAITASQRQNRCRRKVAKIQSLGEVSL